MTDPFFTTGQNITGNTDNTDNKQKEKETLQALLDQQHEIQEKYKELKEMSNSSNLTPDQKEELEQGLNKLITLYKQNKETIASLSTTIDGEKEIHTNTNVSVKKESDVKNVSFKKIAIGCLSLFIFLILIFGLLFLRVIKNPNSFNGIISAGTAIQLTQVFCIIFFAIFFVISVSILVVNVYKLITTKNKIKIKQILGTTIGLILLILTLSLGAFAFSKLRSITPESVLSQNEIISTYAIFADKGNSVKSVKVESNSTTTDPILIAPTNILYKINIKNLQTQLINKYGDITIKKLELDCGNGINVYDISSTLQQQCFYTTKGTKNIGLKITYIKNKTDEQATLTTTLKSLVIASEIGVSTSQGKQKILNNEFDVGKNPVRVIFDASSVFQDLALPNYNISWDVDSDGIVDKANYTTYKHNYKGYGVYNIHIRFPDINDYIYTFPIRIDQSDIPVGELTYSKIKDTQYRFEVNFPSDDISDISSYKFYILREDGSEYDTVSTTNPYITYTFSEDGTYLIQVDYITLEKEQGSADCEDSIVIGDAKYQVSYNISTRSTTQSSYTNQGDTDNITLNELPTYVKININNIIPNTDSTNVGVILKNGEGAGTPIIGKNNVYDIEISDTDDYTIIITVSDKNHEDMTYTKNINISVKRDDIVPKLTITPDTVGTEPFTVKFDASTTNINSNDEIIYFSRDFGDGTTETNTSQSIITHTYNYNYNTENGEYYPTVTMSTRNGRKVSTGAKIQVKKSIENIEISLDSHPAQIAKIGDKVTMRLSNLNGDPSKIVWDFGNGEKFECNGRLCSEITEIYNTPGNYEIKATVSYNNKVDIEGKINLIVK